MFSVKTSSSFTKAIKRLSKKYPNAPKDVLRIVDSLESGNFYRECNTGILSACLQSPHTVLGSKKGETRQISSNLLPCIGIKNPEYIKMRKKHREAIKLMFSAPVRVKQDGKWFISSCHPLDVYSQGATRQEAIRNIEEALKFFIESCLERGTLEQVFRESGFKVTHEIDIGEAINDLDLMVNVPLPMVTGNVSQTYAN